MGNTTLRRFDIHGSKLRGKMKRETILIDELAAAAKQNSKPSANHTFIATDFHSSEQQHSNRPVV